MPLVRKSWRRALGVAALVTVALDAAAAAGVDYDIVYVRVPRYGDQQAARMPEIKDPIQVEPGTDLVLLRPDGSEEVLVAGGAGAILDPAVSFDGKSVYFAKVHDQTRINVHRRDAALSGSDIYRIDLATRQITRLTFQEWTPNTGVAAWSDDPPGPDGPGKSLPRVRDLQPRAGSPARGADHVVLEPQRLPAE